MVIKLVQPSAVSMAKVVKLFQFSEAKATSSATAKADVVMVSVVAPEVEADADVLYPPVAPETKATPLKKYPPPALVVALKVPPEGSCLAFKQYQCSIS